MRFIHTSDLHIGKRVNEFSMLEEQKYILGKILEITSELNADGVLIAGDIYDKAVPSAEAVDLFDDFLTKLSELNIPVFIISGNHDSPERLGFARHILKNCNICIAGEFDAEVPKFTYEKNDVPVNVYLLPYLKPAVVNQKLGLQTHSYDECVRAVLENIDIDKNAKNILLAHQFVTADTVCPECSDSETRSLGGSDNIDVSAFDAFDYVALGHIHRPQQIGRPTVRYSGSPIKYSFSECNHKKSVTVVDINDDVAFRQIDLIPKHDMYEFSCKLNELSSRPEPRTAYVHITLTDEEEIADAVTKVRAVYPNVMLLDFDNSRSGINENGFGISSTDIKEKTILELFEDFYKYQNNNSELNDNQIKILNDIISHI